MKRLAILGSTGSIGVSTLRVVDALGDRFRVVALAAGRNLDLLAEQIERYEPKLVSVRERSKQGFGLRLVRRTIQNDRPQTIFHSILA